MYLLRSTETGNVCSLLNVQVFLMQEFMILPIGASSFKEAMKIGSEIYHNLKVRCCIAR
jgi:hypothetical protein